MAKVTIGYDHVNYQALRNQQTVGRENGLWRYSHTIQDLIAPLVQTNRPIDALGLQACGTEDHAIVFIHHNINPAGHYEWLGRHSDLVLVSGIQQTYDTLREKFPNFHHILLPVSVDADYIRQFLPKGKKKRYPAAYFGNQWSFKRPDIERFVPGIVPRFGYLSHEEHLSLMSKFESVYAVGLTAVEARILGCHLLQCDSRFPNPEETFPPMDYRDAGKILQAQLDYIDKEF